jgi:hypothetical protein
LSTGAERCRAFQADGQRLLSAYGFSNAEKIMAGHSQRIKHSQELTRPSLEFKLQLAADERTLELQQSALRFLASLLFNLEQTKTKATKKAAGVWSAWHAEFSHLVSNSWRKRHEDCPKPARTPRIHLVDRAVDDAADS